jgi:hypothetical protein
MIRIERREERKRKKKSRKTHRHTNEKKKKTRMATFVSCALVRPSLLARLPSERRVCQCATTWPSDFDRPCHFLLLLLSLSLYEINFID